VSSAAPPRLRWWGWGDRDTAIPDGLAALLSDELGIEVRKPSAPSPPRTPVLPASALDGDGLLDELRAIGGHDAVLIDSQSRLRHAAGRSYLDLLELRSGMLEHVPDAVVIPAGAVEIAAVLRACARVGCAVVPFGGGTSVVGGVRPVRGGHRAVVALDTRRLDACTAVDPVSLTATLGAGMTGPQAEAALAAHGLTLGHFPQSFEFATVGGFAATRSAGQASSGYGRFDDIALGLHLVTPTGQIAIPAHPASAAGPSIRQLTLGSEGRLGVITEVTVKVRRIAEQWRYEGWSFPSFGEGIAAVRALAQGRIAPDVARLSDPEESRVGMAISAHGGTLERVARWYLDLRGQRQACLLIVGWGGDALLGGARQAEARVLIRRHGGLALGATPGSAWLRQRYHGPYLRDALVDAGVLVETLETATSWSNVERLHDVVTATLRAALGDEGGAAVGCHVSHVYPSGASLYFTVLARAGADPVARWRSAKRGASTAILDNGGTITHHHAIGTDHREYMSREVGAESIGILRALAKQVDPTGIMNPGKLLPD
jgi:alkyldihydroxyacetonephosphate synthase